MPPLPQLVGVVIIVLVIWFLLKMAKIAIRLILLFITVMLIAGAVYYFLLR